MGLITTISATGLAAGLVLSTAGTASADVTLPSGGVLEQRITSFCNRVPDLLERLDKADSRITGTADTKGSLAWLKDKQTRAQSKNRKRIAERLDRRIERRSERLAKLPELKEKLTAARSECAALDLPVPSAS